MIFPPPKQKPAWGQFIPPRYALSQLAIPCKKPRNAGGLWKGIRHDELYQFMMGKFGCHPTIWLSAGNGTCILTLREDLPIDSLGDFAIFPSIGVMSCNVQTRALTLYNGVVIRQMGSGKMELGYVSHVLTLGGRHGELMKEETTEAIRKGFQFFNGKRTELVQQIQSLSETWMAGTLVRDTGTEAARKGIIPYSRIDAFMGHTEGKTAWEVMLLASILIQRSPAVTQMSRLNKFRNLLTHMIGTERILTHESKD